MHFRLLNLFQSQDGWQDPQPENIYDCQVDVSRVWCLRYFIIYLKASGRQNTRYTTGCLKKLVDYLHEFSSQGFTFLITIVILQVQTLIFQIDTAHSLPSKFCKSAKNKYYIWVFLNLKDLQALFRELSCAWVIRDWFWGWSNSILQCLQWAAPGRVCKLLNFSFFIPGYRYSYKLLPVSKNW